MHDTPSFSDHFSSQAADYERHRPGYPPELFAFLAGVAPARDRALDVATGNGQAATGLAEHFAAVLATEPSEAQLVRARRHPRVQYARGTAEQVDAPDASFDLVTAAQAAHWFDADRFYAEARRVLRPGGVLAVWTYSLFRAGAAVDAVVADFYRNVVGPYWPRERWQVEEGYARLPFPLPEIDAPAFALQTDWRWEQALAYVGTWSAVARYRQLRASDPLRLLEPPLRAAWGEASRTVHRPLHLRVGRN